MVRSGRKHPASLWIPARLTRRNPRKNDCPWRPVSRRHNEGKAGGPATVSMPHRSPPVMKTYRAPWCRLLWILSATASAVCLICAISSWLLSGMGANPLWTRVLSGMVVALVPACALFAVRAYRITGDAILIRRLFWDTRIPLAGLRSACHDADAMRKSVRICGNGGFFSFTGWYWNPVLRKFRAFVTDPGRAVVLRFSTKTIVLSPEDPDSFVMDLGPLPEG